MEEKTKQPPANPNGLGVYDLDKEARAKYDMEVGPETKGVETDYGPSPWQPLLDSLQMFTDDYMVERNQPDARVPEFSAED